MIINLGDSSPEHEPEESTQEQAEAQVDETTHVAAVAEMTEHIEDVDYNVSYEVSEGVSYVIGSQGERHEIGEVDTDVCHETDSQGDQNEVEMESDDSSPDPPGVSTLEWDEKIIAMDTEAIELAFSESRTCYIAKYAVTKEYGSMTLIQIPRNAEIVLKDPHFGRCWMMAIEAELEGLFAVKRTSSSTSRPSRRDAG